MFRALFVVLAMTCEVRAQDPTVTLPKAYRLLFENEQVRVVHVRYAPGERLPVHQHPEHPTVYVYLTDSGPVRFEHTEINALVRRPVKAGTFRVSPGRPETHGVVNLGDIPTEFLRVELKAIPFGVSDLLHRSDKPFDLKVPGRTREFTHPRLVINRLVGPTKVSPSTHGSLLVELSPPKAGSVRWIGPGERPGVDAARQVLQIETRD